MHDNPWIGAIVTYTNLGDSEGRWPPEQYPALVTKVDEAEGLSPFTVSLVIFYETGFFFMQHVPFAINHTKGHWSWI